MMQLSERDRELIVKLIGDRLESEVWHRLGDDWTYFQTDLWPRLMRQEAKSIEEAEL